MLPVLRQVAEALDFAHKKKVIHRDVKPANVMVESDGTVKVLDFGLAAQIRTSFSHLSMAETGKSGTRQYMSPEQWRGQPQGAAADQYALAAMAYEMLGGYVPFDNDDTSVLREIVLKEQPPRLEDYSDTVNAVLARGLAKEAKQRFANCVEFVAALEKAGKAVLEETHETTQPPPAQKAPVELTLAAALHQTLTPKWRDNLTFKLTAGVDLELVWIPAGTFMMGSPENEERRMDNETLHKVTLTKGFWIGKYAVTQEQYKAVTGVNPSYNDKGGKYPVERVSWDDAMGFCRKLTEWERNVERLFPDGYEFSLPTEAQWEYACRAGTTTPFNFGNSLNGDKANCDGRHPYNAGEGKYLEKLTPVGSYEPNAWGLYDMHGNVYEWCRDWYGDYPNGAVVDPIGPSDGSWRVYRGGSWGSLASGCRSADRDGDGPSFSGGNLGFRLALVRVQ